MTEETRTLTSAKRRDVRTVDGFRLRSCDVDDMTAFNEVLMSVFYDMNVSSLECLRRASPDTFYLIEEVATDRVVGAVSLNWISDQFVWQHDAVLLPAYQHRRLFSKLQPFLPRAAAYGGDRNQSSVNCFRNEPLFFAHKQEGFYGQVRWGVRLKAAAPPGVRVIHFRPSEAVDDPLVAKVLDYDARLYDKFSAVRRRQFVVDWLTRSDLLTVVSVAVNDNDSSVCGYGVAKLIRKIDGRFSPVYADDATIGTAILADLADEIPDTTKVYLEVPCFQSAAIRFCRQANMLQTYVSYRIYSSTMPELPFDKLYGCHEFWPL